MKKQNLKKINKQKILKLIEYIEDYQQPNNIPKEMWLAIEECVKKTDVSGMEEIINFHSNAIKRKILQKLIELLEE